MFKARNPPALTTLLCLRFYTHDPTYKDTLTPCAAHALGRLPGQQYFTSVSPIPDLTALRTSANPSYMPAFYRR